MRRILVLTGVLGGGTALVFALAAFTASLFPNGTLVSSQWGGPMVGGGAIMRGGPITMPAGGVVIAAPDVAGGAIKVLTDANGNVVLDANGDPVPDTTGPQP